MRRTTHASAHNRLLRTLRLLALAVVPVLAAAAPDLPATAEAALREAREAARADRHGAAIEAYARAMAAAPGQRPAWLVEYADQHTWAGRLDEAVALYREAAATPDRGQARRALVGLGRALSWQGRHAAATARYREALAIDPADAEARRGLARVLSWRGHHHEAAALMQAHMAAQPGDHEARWVLAESLEWMGRADRALAVLREPAGGAHATADTAGRAPERVAAKRRDLQAALRPALRLDLRSFDRSDGLAIDEQALSGRTAVAQGRGHAGARLSQARYQPQPGTGASTARIRVQRLGLEGRWRFDDRLEWNADLGLDRIDSAGPGGDHDRLTWSTWITLWPRDGLRLDLSSTRYTFDSEITLRQGLTATQTALSADLTPDDRLLFGAKVEQTRHADGNTRQGGELQARWRAWPAPRAWLGARVLQWRFDRPGQPGYYNPARYRSVELTLQASGWTDAGLYWELRFAPGRETEGGGSSRGIRSGSALLAWTPRPGSTLELAYDHTTSRTQPGSGFARGIARLTLQQRL